MIAQNFSYLYHLLVGTPSDEIEFVELLENGVEKDTEHLEMVEIG